MNKPFTDEDYINLAKDYLSPTMQVVASNKDLLLLLGKKLHRVMVAETEKALSNEIKTNDTSK
jgi:hypothetical protein